jgi:hypothetical protein
VTSCGDRGLRHTRGVGESRDDQAEWNRKDRTHEVHRRIEDAFAGSFSPDGKQVVFRLEDGDKHSLAVMDLATRAITPLTTRPEKPRFIDWGTHQ